MKRRLVYSGIVFLLFGQDHIVQLGAGDDSYENMTGLMDSLLGAQSGYNPDFRPRKYYHQQVAVMVGFSMVSLLEVNDVRQSIKINGFLDLTWHDERISWNETEFDGAFYLAAQPRQIWRPRLVMVNTLGDRDPFKDDPSPLLVKSDGKVLWSPGGLLEASCAFNMHKFPFDTQTCAMQFCAMSHSLKHLAFNPTMSHFDMSYLVKDSAWEFINSRIIITQQEGIKKGGAYGSCPMFVLQMKRRASYFVINLILPVILLSFLNNFIFLIPDESGEKISYGISVLLSLSVFLTTVSTMVPRASDNIPAVTVYLFILLMFSCISVLGSIATVFLRHADEEEEAHLKVHDIYHRAVKKITNLNRTLTKIDPITIMEESQSPSSTRSQRRKCLSSPSSKHAFTWESDSNSNIISNSTPSTNKYHTFSKHMNKVCFIVSITLWAITQLVFFAYTMA